MGGAKSAARRAKSDTLCTGPLGFAIPEAEMRSAAHGHLGRAFCCVQAHGREGPCVFFCCRRRRMKGRFCIKGISLLCCAYKHSIKGISLLCKIFLSSAACGSKKRRTAPPGHAPAHNKTHGPNDRALHFSFRLREWQNQAARCITYLT